MIVRDAYVFLVPIFIGLIVTLLVQWTTAAVILFLLAAFVAFFFRNPKRTIPSDPDAIVSPADGRVVSVDRIGNVTKMSIFLSIFDVHVNRSPIRGSIEGVEYRPGKFKVAFGPSASVDNERNVVMVGDGDVKIVFVQIAGIIARRIVFWKRVGEHVEKGELVGLIRFGSRVDVLFPAVAEVSVQKGAKVYGGTTIIGRIHRDRARKA
jgi:phosphatidylserine decarboxylase